MPHPSRNIVVLGAGAIGSTFAFQLARAGGHRVTAVARPGSPRLAQLRRDGGIVNSSGERADVEVAETVDEQTPYDLIIVTLLAHQADAVLPALARSKARSVLFMFNTFQPERLADAVGTDRCAWGMPFVQASLDADGRLKASIGAGGQKSLLSREAWVDLFARSGLPAALEARMPLWLVCHVPLCVAFESISAAGVARGGGASWGEAMTRARGVHEAFRLIQALGRPLYPASKRRLNRAPAWTLATMLWSISRIRSFRELLATGTAECRALIETMVAGSQQAGRPINVPLIEAMRPPG